MFKSVEMLCGGILSEDKKRVFIDTLVRLFYTAVARNDLRMVSMLTSVKRIAHYKTITGMSPLYFARSAEMVDLLIASGADPWSPTFEDKTTPAMAAAYRGDYEVVDALYKHSSAAGRDILKETDRFNQTLGMYMAMDRRKVN